MPPSPPGRQPSHAAEEPDRRADDPSPLDEDLGGHAGREAKQQAALAEHHRDDHGQGTLANHHSSAQRLLDDGDANQATSRIPSADEEGRGVAMLIECVQDCLLDYVRTAFAFDHVTACVDTDTLHIHAYALAKVDSARLELDLAQRLSTDSNGVARCLSLQAEARIELPEIAGTLEAKMSDQTVWSPQ
jgi:hypothetical protein